MALSVPIVGTMNTVSPDVPSPCIVMFGIRCDFTDAIVRGLAAKGMPPSALIVPGHPQIEHPVRVGVQHPTLPIAGAPRASPSMDVPTFQVGRLRSRASLNLVASFQPDAIVVACYPRLIPRAIREIPRYAAINVHPSLLPAHRGPDPLFWIMRNGGAGCGVTVHELSETFDAGDILAQRAVEYPEGIRERDLERLLAAVGSELVVSAATSYLTGDPIRVQQNRESATYESWPTVDDYTISTDRSVRHAWNFVRGVARRGIPVRVTTGCTHLFVIDAVHVAQSRGQPATADDQIAIRFRDGWLLATSHQPSAV